MRPAREVHRSSSTGFYSQPEDQYYVCLSLYVRSEHQYYLEFYRDQTDWVQIQFANVPVPLPELPIEDVLKESRDVPEKWNGLTAYTAYASYARYALLSHEESPTDGPCDWYYVGSSLDSRNADNTDPPPRCFLDNPRVSRIAKYVRNMPMYPALCVPGVSVMGQTQEYGLAKIGPIQEFDGVVDGNHYYTTSRFLRATTGTTVTRYSNSVISVTTGRNNTESGKWVEDKETYIPGRWYRLEFTIGQPIPEAIGLRITEADPEEVYSWAST